MNLMSFVRLIALKILMTSCLITPPSVRDGRPELKSNLRNVKVTCVEETYCKPEENTDYEIVTYYTYDGCNTFDASSPVIALSREDLKCERAGCVGHINTFKDEAGMEDVVFADSGEYTLVIFVDVNQNESIDDDEPFFCNEEVEINSAKRLVELKVEITRSLADLE